MHLILAVYASPKKILEWEEYVNNSVVYPYEGQFRKGVHRPFLSRLPLGLYDIRVKKEIAPLLLRDLGIVHPSDFKLRLPELKAHRMIWYLQLLLKLFRLFSGLEVTPKAEGKQGDKKLSGWMNILYVGSFSDRVIDGVESL